MTLTKKIRQAKRCKESRIGGKLIEMLMLSHDDGIHTRFSRGFVIILNKLRTNSLVAGASMLMWCHCHVCILLWMGVLLSFKTYTNIGNKSLSHNFSIKASSKNCINISPRQTKDSKKTVAALWHMVTLNALWSDKIICAIYRKPRLFLGEPGNL